MTWNEMCQKFEEHEQNSPKEHLTAHVEFSEDSWDKPYTKENRTYVVSSNNKAFQLNKNGYSIFGWCLDGKDNGVRLDWYMQNGWKVINCEII